MKVNEVNEVNEVINNICEKVGIGFNNAKEFVPIFAKYKAINDAFICIGFLIVTIIFVMVVSKLIKGYKAAESWDKDGWIAGIVVSSFLSLICGLVSLFNLFYAIEWLIVPEAMMVQYILDMIK